MPVRAEGGEVFVVLSIEEDEYDKKILLSPSQAELLLEDLIHALAKIRGRKSGV